MVVMALVGIQCTGSTESAISSALIGQLDAWMGLHFTVPGHAIGTLRKALQCLTRFGEDVDISAGSHSVRLSSVNASRSAFAAISFDHSFFTKLSVRNTAHPGKALRYCVNAKALYAAHKAKQAESIEWSVSDDDADATLNQDASNECRIAVKLNCAHGVVKTYKLTYGGSDALVCRPDRNQLYSTWSASGRQLKEMVDHFHMRGTGAGEEITLYCRPESCSIRSFRDPIGGESRPGEPPTLSTELTLEPESFDSYSVSGSRTVSFALKEFKAIVSFADGVLTKLTCHFVNGGTPVIFDFYGDSFSGEFVIATDDYDDATGQSAAAAAANGSGATAVKKERSVSQTPAGQQAGMRQSTLSIPIAPPPRRQQQQQQQQSQHLLPSSSRQPLFRPVSATPELPRSGSGAPNGNNRRDDSSEDEFDRGFDDDLNDEDLARLELMSQVSASQRGVAAAARQASPAATNGHNVDAPPKQTKKRERDWRLLDDDDL